MPEDEFYALMKAVDSFDISFEEGFTAMWRERSVMTRLG